jgi:hypothetical protein
MNSLERSFSYSIVLELEKNFRGMFYTKFLPELEILKISSLIRSRPYAKLKRN